MASKSPSSASAAGGGSEEKLAPTIGAPPEDVKQKGPAMANIAAAGAGDGGEAKAASKQPYLSSSDDEDVPRTKRGHWSSVELFGSWPAYDRYDDIKEVDSEDCSSNDDSQNDKSRHILAKLERGEYIYQHGVDIFSCPFCDRKIGTDFNSVVIHAESLCSCNAKVGSTVNKWAFIAKHVAFGVHLRMLRALAIEQGVVQAPKPKPPKVKGQRRNKKKKSHKKY